MGLRKVTYGLPAMKAHRNYRTRQLAARHPDHFAGFRFARTAAFLDPVWEPEERAIIKEQVAARDWASHGTIAAVGRSYHLFLPT